jgi:hypothetical protein
LAKGLENLFGKGAVSALFLSLTPPPAGARAPHFSATALSGDVSRKVVWTGLKWDPSVVPAAWNYFIKVGYVELAPPGANTDQMSQRNVLRAAFGIQPNEWLLLIQIGPQNACRGALAVITKRSIVPELHQAITAFRRAPPKMAA